MWRASTAVLLAALSAACVASRDEHAASAAADRVAFALERSGTPDAAWVAAAFLRSRGEHAPAPGLRGLLEHATASAPDDRAVALVALRLCDAAISCDPIAAAERLRVADPGNAVALVPRLQRAVAADDDADVALVLARMAAADHWNLYFNEIVARSTRALVAAAPYMTTADARNYRNTSRAYGNSAGLMAALLVPPLAPIARSCSGLEDGSARRTTCSRIARAMQASDTFLMQGLGTSMALRLTAAGSPDREAAIAARRRHEWQMEGLGRVNPNRTVREYPELASRFSREQEVAIELMRRHGIAADPPADWRPEIGDEDVAPLR